LCLLWGLPGASSFAGRLAEELSFTSKFIEGRLSLCDADTGTAFASEERRKVSASLLDSRGIFQGEMGRVGDGSAFP
jgi:hypothetical protein